LFFLGGFLSFSSSIDLMQLLYGKDEPKEEKKKGVKPRDLKAALGDTQTKPLVSLTTQADLKREDT